MCVRRQFLNCTGVRFVNALPVGHAKAIPRKFGGLPVGPSRAECVIPGYSNLQARHLFYRSQLLSFAAPD